MKYQNKVRFEVSIWPILNCVNRIMLFGIRKACGNIRLKSLVNPKVYTTSESKDGKEWVALHIEGDIYKLPRIAKTLQSLADHLKNLPTPSEQCNIKDALKGRKRYSWSWQKERFSKYSTTSVNKRKERRKKYNLDMMVAEYEKMPNNVLNVQVSDTTKA
jgi:hypothetical protein